MNSRSSYKKLTVRPPFISTRKSCWEIDLFNVRGTRLATIVMASVVQELHDALDRLAC